MTQKQFVEYLNDIEIPEHDKKKNGGRIPRKAKYGSWLKKNDPIAFNVAYQEHERENHFILQQASKLIKLI